MHAAVLVPKIRYLHCRDRVMFWLAIRPYKHTHSRVNALNAGRRLFFSLLYFGFRTLAFSTCPVGARVREFIGASLSEPHTSVTAFAEVVCMYVCLSVCGHIP